MFGNAKLILKGLRQYVKEVNEGIFPQDENYFKFKDEEYDQLMTDLVE